MKKSILIGAAVICAVAALVCVAVAVAKPWETENQISATPTTTATVNAPPMTKPTNPLYVLPDPELPPEETVEYISPIDFEYLKSVNSDIYAWIEIPGTNISYPILQSATDDNFYLNHDEKKQENVVGAIYTEHWYNDTSFSDAVTVLYGHNMSSRYKSRMFGELQSLYWDEGFLRENNEIIVYLPDKELRFEIFAALPYSRMHLLYYYQTEKQDAFELMINDIYSTRMLNTVLLEEKKPVFGDQVVVLSTCLSGDNSYRYLVLGVCKGNN